MNGRLKRILSGIVFVSIFVIYFLSVDPDSTVLQNIPFGVDIILAIRIFILAIIGIVLIEFIPDFFVDDIYGKEEDARKIANRTSTGAGMVLIAKSIRLFGYSIIVAGSIIAYYLKWQINI